jgi:hypothetical protein
LPKSYSINANNSHFNDTGLTGEYQKEVYLLSRDLLRKMAKLNNNDNDNDNNNNNNNYKNDNNINDKNTNGNKNDNNNDNNDNNDNNIDNNNKDRSVLTAIDVGCGSGWKLVKYISEEFRTIGIDTEPALSFLKKKYPKQVINYRQPSVQQQPLGPKKWQMFRVIVR